MIARLAWRLSAHFTGPRRRFLLGIVVRAIERGEGRRVFAVRLRPFVW